MLWMISEARRHGTFRNMVHKRRFFMQKEGRLYVSELPESKVIEQLSRDEIHLVGGSACGFAAVVFGPGRDNHIRSLRNVPRRPSDFRKPAITREAWSKYFL